MRAGVATTLKPSGVSKSVKYAGLRSSSPCPSYAIWKLWGPRVGAIAAAVSGVLVLGIGFSRVYLGVHWPFDVVAGYAMGLGWALLLIALAQSWLRRVDESCA